MHRRPLSLALVILAILALPSCDGLTGGDTSRQTVNRTYKLAEAASSQGGAAPADDTTDTTAAVRTIPVLYQPDATGKYLVSKELTTLSLRDQTLDVKLVDALHQAGVLDSGVTLQSLSLDMAEDKTTELVLLDFNKRFQNQLKTCQTPEEERLLVGSVLVLSLLSLLTLTCARNDLARSRRSARVPQFRHLLRRGPEALLLTSFAWKRA